MNQQNNQQKKEFSEEGGNLEIISQEKLPLKNSGGNIIVADKNNVDAKKSKVIIGKLNVFITPFRRRHEKYYRASKFHLAVDAILALIVVALTVAVVYFAFWHPGKNITLDLSMENEKIASGNVETLVIAYGNKNGEELRDGNIAVDLPEKFLIERVEPENIFDAKTNTFRLGDLAAGANGKIKIRGLIMGNLGSQETAVAIFSFKINGKKSSVLNSIIYTVEDSMLNLALSAPAEVYQGTLFNGGIKVRNTGANDFDNAELAIEGDNWEIKQSSCALNNNVMSLGEIKAGEEIAIDFSAIAKNGEGERLLALAGYIAFGKERLKQAVVEKQIAVKTPQLKVSLNPDKKAMEAEEEINFRFNYKNNEKEKVGNIKIALAIGNKNFGIRSFNVSGPAAVKKENDNILTIAGLEAGEEGTADLKVKFDRKKIGTEEAIYAQVTVSYEIGGQAVEYAIKSAPVKVISTLNIKSAGYYYSLQGDQLGVGPLPPTVDMATNYWILWEIDNLGNNLKDVSITAELPENVVWTDNKSLLAGNLLYGQVGRRVIWSVDEVGKNGGNYKAGFEVGVIPGRDDIGKILNLAIDIKYSAYDSFCEKEIGGNLKNVTTNLEFDRLASGKGEVVE
ncbi:hypothetical protein HY798_04510 [Candidatus Falkowbacteria bacterium]|nr:hypothetical protein [Candidatus Falkowbacteria bacterium]